MAVADSKKVQTLINRTGLAVQRMRVDLAEIVDYEARLAADGASTNGTPFQGQIAQLNGLINSLNATLTTPIADTAVANIVPSHRGGAL